MKTEKIEIRLSAAEKEVLRKLVQEHDLTTTKLVKIALYDWIFSKYPVDKAKELTDVFRS